MLFGLLLAAPRVLVAQERGAIALGEAVLGLGVNTRVLMIGAHPDDEDTNLIAWLSRGRHVSTAYLSLTRGDGGQNLIGNELGEALGVIRTEELRAARTIDGAEQYFTRAYDFGFSKDTVDAYKHWPKDTILSDVIRVVRAFRPHVIVAVFSGTTRDGHGHHQVSGLLAREAYDLAGDTIRFAPATFGTGWTPLKFYRGARGSQQNGTVGMDVGEYSPLLGRSYAEIAGESRSQHKSQGFGALERKGPVMNYLRREASRVNEATPASSEKSLFDGIDTTWARFQGSLTGAQRSALDLLPEALNAVRAAYDPFSPERLLSPLDRVRRLIRGLCEPTHQCIRELIDRQPQNDVIADLIASVETTRVRLENALGMASGVTIEATAMEHWPLRAKVPVVVTVYNRGVDTARISEGTVVVDYPHSSLVGHTPWVIPPGGLWRDTLVGQESSTSQPRWLVSPRAGSTFWLAQWWIQRDPIRAAYMVRVPQAGDPFILSETVVHRFADQIKGDIRRPVVGVPAITITPGQRIQYARANTDIDRQLDVLVRSADDQARNVTIRLMSTRLTVDNRVIRGGDSIGAVALQPGQSQTLTFRLRGRLSPGTTQIRAFADTGGQGFHQGYDLIDYDHIRPQRVYRPAVIQLSVVDVGVPASLRVGYIPGVSDNIAPTLSQLGVPVTVIPARDVPRASLAEYTTIVVGPRAYEANPELIAANARLLDFARNGGTVVVQYGQYEMTQPGIMPYPITINRPHDRVTHEDAPVTILDPTARELTTPNRISDADFAGWVQERSLYMPRTFDPKYRSLLAMSDPGEAANRGAILVAPVGSGVYIYTTLAFFRQLPAGNPGAARLFVNLLSAGLNRPRNQ